MYYNDNSLAIPTGLKDYLPHEAHLKRKLECKWEQLFSSWGYDEVVTPTFEYFNILCKGLEGEETTLHKMIDRDGKILALRPDMTNPIARLVATRLKNESFPLRFFYIANVFRNEAEIQRGRQREFYQAGVELLGAKNSWADAEVIALAIESLESAGLEEFKIGLGHVKITSDLLNILCEDERLRKELKIALMKKSYVTVDNLIADCKSSKNTEIKEIITKQWHNGQLIKKLKGIVRDEDTYRAVIDLENVVNVLQRLDLGDKVFIDLSILRDFEYYTGIVFEGYSSKLGYPLLGGGRYDKLLSKYGFDCPATGFALGIERVLSALDEDKYGDHKIDYLLVGKDYVLLNAKARELRVDGYRVEIDLLNMSLDEAREYAKEKGISNVIEVKGE